MKKLYVCVQTWDRKLLRHYQSHVAIIGCKVNKKSLRVLRVFCWILIDPPWATKPFLSPRRIPLFCRLTAAKVEKTEAVGRSSSSTELITLTFGPPPNLFQKTFDEMRATITNCNYNFCGSKPEAREVNFKIISHRKWLFLKYEALSRLSKWVMKYVEK